MQDEMKLTFDILKRVPLLRMITSCDSSFHGSDSCSPLLSSESAPRVKHANLPLVDENLRNNVVFEAYERAYERGNTWCTKECPILGDLFHTLVNIPNGRFMLVLLLTYTLLFGGFAIPYYYDAYNNSCIPGVQSFTHALWFSVQTAMTIGYGGDLTPDPNCTMTNIVVVIQSLVNLLVAYSLLGIFYVRFARPARRAQTLMFSKKMVIYEEDGFQVLALRMANLRKHQIIEANVRLLIGLNNNPTEEDESVFHFSSLSVIGGNQVFLGLPSTVKHRISCSSPLYKLSLEDMEDADVEILVLLEGVDASTSSKLQARRSYRPSDICTNHRFETVVGRTKSGRRCVDFTKFDSVLPVNVNMFTRPNASLPVSPSLSAIRLPGIQHFHSGGRMSETNNSDWKNFLGDTAQGTSPQGMSNLSVNTDEACSPYEGQVHLPVLKSLQRSSVHFNPKATVRSTAGHSDNEILTAFDTEDNHKHRELVQRALLAESKAELWRQMVIQLASGIQETMQQNSTVADAGPLLASAEQALTEALSDQY